MDYYYCCSAFATVVACYAACHLATTSLHLCHRLVDYKGLFRRHLEIAHATTLMVTQGCCDSTFGGRWADKHSLKYGILKLQSNYLYWTQKRDNGWSTYAIVYCQPSWIYGIYEIFYSNRFSFIGKINSLYCHDTNGVVQISNLKFSLYSRNRKFQKSS